MENIFKNTEIPMGFSMALAQNLPAMQYFAGLSENQRNQIVKQTHQIQSKEEMQSFVSSLTKNGYQL